MKKGAANKPLLGAFLALLIIAAGSVLWWREAKRERLRRWEEETKERQDLLREADQAFTAFTGLSVDLKDYVWNPRQGRYLQRVPPKHFAHVLSVENVQKIKALSPNSELVRRIHEAHLTLREFGICRFEAKSPWRIVLSPDPVSEMEKAVLETEDMVRDVFKKLRNTYRGSRSRRLISMVRFLRRYHSLNWKRLSPEVRRRYDPYFSNEDFRIALQSELTPRILMREDRAEREEER